MAPFRKKGKLNKRNKSFLNACPTRFRPNPSSIGQAVRKLIEKQAFQSCHGGLRMAEDGQFTGCCTLVFLQAAKHPQGCRSGARDQSARSLSYTCTGGIGVGLITLCLMDLVLDGLDQMVFCFVLFGKQCLNASYKSSVHGPTYT